MNPTRLLLLSMSAMLTLLLLIEWNEFSAERSANQEVDRFSISDQSTTMPSSITSAGRLDIEAAVATTVATIFPRSSSRIPIRQLSKLRVET